MVMETKILRRADVSKWEGYHLRGMRQDNYFVLKINSNQVTEARRGSVLADVLQRKVGSVGIDINDLFSANLAPQDKIEAERMRDKLMRGALGTSVDIPERMITEELRKTAAPDKPQIKDILQELLDMERLRNPFVPEMRGIKEEDPSEGAKRFGERLDGLFRAPVDPNKAS